MNDHNQTNPNHPNQPGRPSSMDWEQDVKLTRIETTLETIAGLMRETTTTVREHGDRLLIIETEIRAERKAAEQRLEAERKAREDRSKWWLGIAASVLSAGLIGLGALVIKVFPALAHVINKSGGHG